VRTDIAVILTWRAGQARRAVGTQLERALHLARRLDDPAAAARVSWGLWTHHGVRAELGRAGQMARELVVLAEQAGDPSVRTIASIAVAATAYQQGRHVEARAALERAGDTLEVVRDGHSQRPCRSTRACTWAVVDAMVRWFCGDEQPAWSAMQAAVEQACALGHPYTEQFARSFQLILGVIRDDLDWASAAASALLSATRELGFDYTATIAEVVAGWVRAREGDPGGIEAVRAAIAERLRLEAAAGRPLLHGMLADALIRQGRPAEALDACATGLADAERLGERYWEAELHRRQGEALSALAKPDEANVVLRRAREVATRQGAGALLARVERDLAATSSR
jgi:tetratricopeptide (TPR) repeat protein